jgi:hypothetical protein
MKVTLLKPHTHAGTEHQPGESLDLDTEQAEWLRAQGVAAPAKPEPKKSTQGE